MSTEIEVPEHDCKEMASFPIHDEGVSLEYSEQYRAWIISADNNWYRNECRFCPWCGKDLWEIKKPNS